MYRYFIEVAYKGTNYSGFQIQQNANSIQSEVNNALKTFFRKNFQLTGSSRTDAGVHALQNYFHFDSVEELNFEKDFTYNLNALLPKDIVIKKIFPVKSSAHCRFDAVSREYKYFIHQDKNPFVLDTAFYFPFKIDIDLLNQAAKEIMSYDDFESFSKKNTQAKTSICKIIKSEWYWENDILVYKVVANRFLRGMVKGLVGTMLKCATGKLAIQQFSNIIENKDLSRVYFSPPSHGLVLQVVKFRDDIFSL